MDKKRISNIVGVSEIEYGTGKLSMIESERILVSIADQFERLVVETGSSSISMARAASHAPRTRFVPEVECNRIKMQVKFLFGLFCHPSSFGDYATGVGMAKRRKVQIIHDEVVRLFAARLRAVRLSRGLTQAELARQARVTPTYISRLESAGAAPGIDLVARLAGTLGTTTTDLLPVAVVSDPLPAFKEQAKKLLEALLERGDCETFQQLNPFLALLVEASAKRGSN